VLVDWHGASAKRYPLQTTQPTLSTAAEGDIEAKRPAEYTLVAVFERKTGKYIYTGTSRGHFNIIDADTREVLLLRLTLPLTITVTHVFTVMYCRN